MRGREFLWIEAHDVFTTQEEALEQVGADMETTRTVLIENLGIPVIFFRRPAFDKFPGAEDTYAADALMPDSRVIQLPSTHYLGQGFAKAFNLSYEDERGEKQTPHQTCYGPPISRTLAVLGAIHGDKKGLIIPISVAPVQVVVVPIIFKGKDEGVHAKCLELTKLLEDDGLRVFLDDSDKKPGAKYYYWEMKGVPVRAEIGPRDLEKGTVTLVRRDTGEKRAVRFGDVTNEIGKLGENILKNLRDRAGEDLKEHISEADDMEELVRVISEKGGFVRVPFCSRELDGEACAEEIKERTDADIRGTVFNQEEVPEGKTCIACDRPAKHIVMAARAY
jgi:prolyl-tRNA synthetase